MSSFSGSWVALVTPFKAGEVDIESLIKLLDFHLAQKTDGLVICGTTAESATLSTEEKLEIMRQTANRISGKLPIVFGTGSNDTQKTVELTAKAKDLGACGVLVVTPYYNKPSQRGLIEHYKETAKATTLPVILYNVPGRTGVNLTSESTLELAQIPNITAIKEASGNLGQISEIIRKAPNDFELLSGEDSLNFSILALGGKGCISVTANVDPKRMKAFNDACRQKDWELGRQLHFDLLDLHEAMFLDANPVPAKTALHFMNFLEEEFRLPLTKTSDSIKARIRKTLERMNLLPC